MRNGAAAPPRPSNRSPKSNCDLTCNNPDPEPKDVIAKCAIAHGLALSVKLAVFEEAIEKTIQGTKHLPEDLAQARS